jgi:indole-3-glycerol phosphate synthase
MILDNIVAAAKIRVERRKVQVPLETIKKAALCRKAAIGFPFENALRKPDIGFICEVKRASPSQGKIVGEFPYIRIAKEYEQAGAAAISVLTEPEFFLGRDEDLAEISAAVSIPVLRKDFIVDSYQIYEAKLLGASAVLLICAVLDAAVIRSYIDICDELGLSALVEAHDAGEVEAAVTAKARMIGVNNRNLKDFTVDLGNSIRLRRLVPENLCFIAESGIKTAADIEMLRQAKINGVLIGETLMRSPNKQDMLAKLRGKGK